MWLYAGYAILLVCSLLAGLLGLIALIRGHFKLTSGKRCEGKSGRMVGLLYLLTAVLALGSMVLYENRVGAGLFRTGVADLSDQRQTEIATNEILLGLAFVFGTSALATQIALLTAKPVPENVFPELPRF